MLKTGRRRFAVRNCSTPIYQPLQPIGFIAPPAALSSFTFLRISSFYRLHIAFLGQQQDRLRATEQDISFALYTRETAI